MAENRFLVRRGENAPTTSLLMPYELGFDTLNNALYILSIDGSLITDLTDTVWEIKENPNISSAFEYDINFYPNNQTTNNTKIKTLPLTGYDYKTAGSISTLANTEWYGQDLNGMISPYLWDGNNLINTTWYFNDSLSTSNLLLPLFYTTTRSGGIDLRSGPGSAYPVINTLSPGNIVYWSGEEAPDWDDPEYTWYHTNLGWASKEYITQKTTLLVNFNSNSQDFNSIVFSNNSVSYKAGNIETLVYTVNNGWKNNYRTIEFTGGDNISLSGIFAWLNDQAQLQNFYLRLNGNIAGFGFSKLVFDATTILAQNDQGNSSSFWSKGNWIKNPLGITDGIDKTKADFITWLKNNALIRMENLTYYILKYDNEIYYTDKNYNKFWNGVNEETRKNNRTINIIDGTDVTNTNLITWFKNNARLKLGAAFKNLCLIKYNPYNLGEFVPLSGGSGSSHAMRGSLYIKRNTDGSASGSIGIHICKNDINRGSLYHYLYLDGSTNADFLALTGRNKSGTIINGVRFYDNGLVNIFGNGSNHIGLSPYGAGSNKNALIVNKDGYVIIGDANGIGRWCIETSSDKYTGWFGMLDGSGVDYIGGIYNGYIFFSNYDVHLRPNGYTESGHDLIWTNDSLLIARGLYSNTTTSSANANIGSGGYIQRSTSLRKYKTDITTVSIEDANKGYNLRPIQFKGICKHDSDLLQYGFIAEEVAEVLPNLVTYDDEGTLLGVAYDRVCAILLKQNQLLKERVDNLEQQINNLK